MRVVFAVIAVVVGFVVAALLTGSSAWSRVNAEMRGRLAPAAVTAAAYSPASLEGLPEPAIRYFRRVLKDGQPLVRSVVAKQEAEFFINGAWRPLRATQHFATSPPGFVWDARIGMAPLVSANVRDAYVGGRGSMLAKLLGVYTLADQAGAPELNAGALQRFLGEAIWFPTALLPSPSLQWSPRDDRTAIATLTDGSTRVSLAFEIGAEGLVQAISGDRYQEHGGAYSLQPWRIQCDEHRERDGMTIPLRCEVAWIAAGRPEPYWRGRITSIDYEFGH